MNKRQTVLCLGLAGACGLAAAQEPTAGSISLGAGYWSDPRPWWGIYDGMKDEGGYLLLDGNVRRRDDATGTWFRFDASNLGLETSEIRVEAQRQGDMGGFVEYSRIVRDNPYTFLTGVQGIGTAFQRVPTPSATALGETHLGTARDRIGAGFQKHFGGGYDLRVAYSSEDKTGTRQWGRGGAPEFAVEPIDWSTRQLEAVLSYNRGNLQLQGGYYGSWFTNANSVVDTALATGANRYVLSLPMDNQAHQFFVNGGYNFTQATRGTFKVSYTQATQNETMPTFRDVPDFAGAPTNLNGRLDNTLVQAGLTSRTSSTFSWLANLRYYESDEKTLQARIIQTNPVCPTATACVDNTPLTFKTVTGKLEGTYRLMPGLALTGGVEHSDQDRTVAVGTQTAAGDIQRWVPWRAEIEETTYRIQLRRSLSETLNGMIGYAYSKRDGSEFTLAPADPTTANLINPIHIADRDRDRFRLMLDWTPTQPLTLTLNAEYARDEYGHTDSRPYGLRKGEATLYSLDAAYSITDRWKASAWYSRDEAKANQVNQRLPDVKDANLEDAGDNLGVGLTGQLTAALKTGIEALYSKNTNKYPESITPSGNYAANTIGPLPDITNKLVRVKLYATYAVQKNAEVRVDYTHERWKTDDWTWFFANNSTPFTYGATTDGTQVINNRTQNSDFIGVRYINRFQ